MATVKVKASKRNGKIVKAHMRNVSGVSSSTPKRSSRVSGRELSHKYAKNQSVTFQGTDDDGVESGTHIIHKRGNFGGEASYTVKHTKTGATSVLNADWVHKNAATKSKMTKRKK